MTTIHIIDAFQGPFERHDVPDGLAPDAIAVDVLDQWCEGTDRIHRRVDSHGHMIWEILTDVGPLDVFAALEE